MRHTVDCYFICWNEIKVLPFMMQYLKKLGVRNIYVYDNGSDDGSIEYLKSFGNVTLRHFDSNGIDERAYLAVKNHCWKDSDADWVIVCDTDEAMYCTTDFDDILDYYEKNGISCVAPLWTDIYSEKFPEYDENRLMHEITGGVVKQETTKHNKFLLFQPSKIAEINYLPGCHYAQPKWRVGVYPKVSKMSGVLYTVHMKSLEPQYRIDRNKVFAERLSEYNNRRGYAFHYKFSEEQVLKEFEENLPKVKPI